MSLFKILKKGVKASASSYKLMLVIWIITLVLVFAVGYPLKSFLNTIFGDSMAVERLMDGFDLGLIGDISRPFGGLMAGVAAGTLFISLAGFVLMTFFAGGLFRRFTISWGGLSVSEFFRASANNFIPFLKIALLMMLIIGAYTFIIIGIPGIIIMMISDKQMPGGAAIYPFYAIWALGMPVWIFIADASRRWVAATGSPRVFRAIGTALRALRERFWLSYGTVFAIVMINAAFVLVALLFTMIATPQKGIMIFLFFILTQLLVIFRIFMKAWRYAAVCEAVTLPGGKSK